MTFGIAIKERNRPLDTIDQMVSIVRGMVGKQLTYEQLTSQPL